MTYRRRASLGAGAVALAALLVGVVATTAYAALTVTSYSPTTVAASAGANTCQVIITGTDFTGVTGVSFNGTAAPAGTFTADSTTQLTVTVPSGATTGAVTVTTTTTPGGVAGPSLTIGGSAANCPTITNVSPSSGTIGTTVTLTGTNLSGVTAVRFGTAQTVPTGTPTATSLSVVVPAGATSGPIRVLNATGWGSSAISFTVNAVPTISSFTPTSGAVGTSVVITGTNFTGATSVKFNGVAATTFTVNSPTQITATVPTGATTGKITVTTPGGTATSTTNFTVSGTGGVSRTVTLQLSGHLRVIGDVNSQTAKCMKFVPVRVQKQKSGGGWKTLELLSTDRNGSYFGFVPNRSGRYRTVAMKVTLADGTVCASDTSPSRRYTR